MITPPHVAAACLIASGAEELFKNKESLNLTTLYVGVSLVNFALHYILDLIPHGHTVNPFAKDKKLGLLFLELAISASIALFTMFLSHHPLLIVAACVSSLIPDYISTSLASLKLPKPVFAVFHQIQRFHFFIHWFEEIDENGERIVPLPSKREIVFQGMFVILCIVAIVLFKV